MTTHGRNAWKEERATTERGVVTQPAGRRPAGNLAAVTQPMSEEDRWLESQPAR
jgi:hypothetical protein